MGEDSHRLIDGGPLLLGGIRIPHDQQLVGHSDADALLHAVTDSLLGAAALGDIGEMFPNTDETNRERDSAEMLAAAHQLTIGAGYRIVNLDLVVHAERPKITPHKKAMRQRIAEILEIEIDQIGLKAKTGEGVGPVGRAEAIQTRAIVLLAPLEKKES